MTTVTSMATASLYSTQGRRQPSYYSLELNSAPLASLSSWTPTELSVQYDHRGRLQPFVETSEQRRARVEFLRKREFSRRISAWLADSSKPEVCGEDHRFQRRASC